jgi:hypothetical protein
MICWWTVALFCNARAQSPQINATWNCDRYVKGASRGDNGVVTGLADRKRVVCRVAYLQSAIAALFRVMNRYVGNLPPMPGVFPDYPAPVVRNALAPSASSS